MTKNSRFRINTVPATTLQWTNANYYDDIKNEEETEQNAMIVVLEENDAVVTVLLLISTIPSARQRRMQGPSWDRSGCETSWIRR